MGQYYVKKTPEVKELLLQRDPLRNISVNLKKVSNSKCRTDTAQTVLIFYTFVGSWVISVSCTLKTNEITQGPYYAKKTPEANLE